MRMRRTGRMRSDEDVARMRVGLDLHECVKLVSLEWQGEKEEQGRT